VLGENGEEIIAAPGWGNVPEVQIFGTDGKFIRKFLGYSQSFRGGVNVAAGDLDNDGQSEIVLGAGFTGGPHVRIFDGEGKLKDQFFSFDKGSRNGTLVGVGKFVDGKNKIVAMPNKTAPSGRTDLYKYIDIDISEQKMKIFENGFNLGEYLVSTGTTKMPTPIGTFKILSKSELAYSNAYSLYMPNFMLFTKGGAGIHGLPFWKNGSKVVYEGVNHLGKRVSHGCVRLALNNAIMIFAWADKGTPVIVHQ
jgi:lipoprotein-anchoring transpeptidase ErfK/SrfK